MKHLTLCGIYDLELKKFSKKILESDDFILINKNNSILFYTGQKRDTRYYGVRSPIESTYEHQENVAVRIVPFVRSNLSLSMGSFDLTHENAHLFAKEYLLLYSPQPYIDLDQSSPTYGTIFTNSFNPLSISFNNYEDDDPFSLRELIRPESKIKTKSKAFVYRGSVYAIPRYKNSENFILDGWDLFIRTSRGQHPNLLKTISYPLPRKHFNIKLLNYKK